MNMAETKLSRGRGKKEPVRATDDAMHEAAVTPMNGARTAEGNNPPPGKHAMNGDHRINGEHLIAVDDDERRRLIAEAAYYRALRRGFTNGSPESDWLEAEAEIVALLANAGMRV